jgi:hypothetical protein
LATEYESLRLSVSLTDNVTSQLDKIRGSLANMGGGAAGSGMERLKRQSRELGEQMKTLASGFAGSGTAATNAVKSLGLVTAGVGAASFAMVQGVRSIGEYTSKMQELGRMASQTGIGAGQLKELSDQLARNAGISIEAAGSNLRGLATAMADINRQNSELRRTALAGLQGNDRAAMEMLLGDLGRVANDPASFANKVKEALDNVYANVLDQTKNSARAAEARKNFANLFGAPDLGELQGTLQAASAMQEAMWSSRITQAQEFNRVTADISQSWGLITDSVKALATPTVTAVLTPIATALRESAEQIQTAIEALRTFEPPQWMANLVSGIAAGGQKAADVLNTVQGASQAAGASTRGAIGRGVDWVKGTTKANNAARGGIDAAASIPVPAFAAGGSIGAGQLSLVGEKGPELFAPSQGGSIIPNWMLKFMTDHMGTYGLKGVLQTAVHDSNRGHPIRSKLRAMLGLEDPGEAAPWQVAGRASGGSVTGGASYAVGELGPELFVGSGGGGGSSGQRLIAEQTRQTADLNQNTEGQTQQMRSLTEELQTLNRRLEGATGGGGGSGGAGAGGGGGPRMGGLSGLPGFGGLSGGGGGGSSGGAGASGSWSGGSAAQPSMAPQTAGQAGTGSGKAAAEAYLGRSISAPEYDSLMRATHAESGARNSPEEQAMIMGSILNRAREHKGGITGALNAPNQFQAVTGTKFDPGPSRNYRQGPSESRAASIETAAQNLLHRVPTDQKNFTAASRAAYGPGTNVGYLDQLQRTGGGVYGGTQFAGRLAAEQPGGKGDSVVAQQVRDGQSRVKQLQAGIRNKPVDPVLLSQLEAAAQAADVNVGITSGGQDRIGRGGRRTGSTRHDEGAAADLHLTDPKTGRKLDMRNSADQARMASFVKESVASGATGVGAGLGYMGASTMHIGGGTSAAWGGTSGQRAPDWIAGAHREGTAERMARAQGGGSRAALDADMDRSMTHRVEGSGKLTVDVNAPAGTKVAAEGGGIFKTVETNRQVQMAPASEGPSTSV